MIEPLHTIETGGVSRRLRYRFSDWARGERISGVGIRSGWGIPITTPAQMLPMLLLVGLNHEMPGLTLDSAADLVTFEREDELLEACVKAVYDYDPVSKKKLEALETATKAAGLQHQELTMLVELIRSTIGDASGHSSSTDAI